MTSMTYVLIIGIVNSMKRKSMHVQIDYNNLSIRCIYCLSILYLICDYWALLRQKCNITIASIKKQAKDSNRYLTSILPLKTMVVEPLQKNQLSLKT